MNFNSARIASPLLHLSLILSLSLVLLAVAEGASERECRLSTEHGHMAFSVGRLESRFLQEATGLSEAAPDDRQALLALLRAEVAGPHFPHSPQ